MLFKSNIVFSGCSFTQGFGLPTETSDENLWVNILTRELFDSCTLYNKGIGGSSNHDILLSSIEALSLLQPKYLFVAWTEINRMFVNPGVELYDTKIYLGENSLPQSITINPNITYSKSYIQNIQNRFFNLKHPHYEIVNIIRYSKIILDLCQKFNTTVFFVNSILPWDKNYFDVIDLETNSPDLTTAYTKQILNLDTRDDNEYKQLYYKMHKDYELLKYTRNHWLNLDQSFASHFYIDIALDGLHPGVKSNQLFAEFLTKQITTSNKFL